MDLAMDSLGALNVFVRVTETRSFTGAASRLGVSPSAVGKAIARLEAQLGTRLFHRSTRSVALNLAGDLYPDTPHVSNFTEAQAVDPEQDFTLTWDTWVGGTVNDVLFVSVRDSAGHTVFSSAEQAELSEDGAAGFLRELVKSDLGNEYGMELRRWIEELEVNLSRRVYRAGDAVPNGTTRIIPVKP